MGTRGAYGFVVGGKSKISYSHYDSYPSGLGNDIVHFLSCNSLSSILKYAKFMKTVNANNKPTPTQLKKLESLGFSTPDSETDWYHILREFQGDLQKTFSLQYPFASDDKSFLLDSLFCEYAYIINLDDGVLEFYQGFNKSPILTGRFANATEKNGYFPVRLVKNYPLADLFACDSSIIVKDMEMQVAENEDED